MTAMKKVLLAAMMFGKAALSPLLANMPLTDEIAARDKAADDAVAVWGALTDYDWTDLVP